MQQVALKVNYRKDAGGTAVKRLRNTGLVPGIVYGAHTRPVMVQVPDTELQKALHSSSSENVLVELELSDGGAPEKRLALVQEVQHDHLTGTVIHVDFHEVRADEKLTANVPVMPTGEAVGVKSHGGVLEYAMRSLRLRCLPKDMPDHIVVDVSNLNIGQAIHVSEVALPPGVEVLDRKDLPVFTVVAPTIEEEPTPAEAAPTEPEVITEKKAEGEEEAPAEGKAAAKEPKPAAGKEAKPEAKVEAKPGAAPGKPEAKAPAAAPAKPEAKPAAKKK
ncbi:MAG: 50S ribosomal protein L25 [Verrucomicrobia bacterium]|nr:50S ribosomal protein L25 [Verrucomicrobiota bacterium]